MAPRRLPCWSRNPGRSPSGREGSRFSRRTWRPSGSSTKVAGTKFGPSLSPSRRHQNTPQNAPHVVCSGSPIAGPSGMAVGNQDTTRRQVIGAHAASPSAARAQRSWPGRCAASPTSAGSQTGSLEIRVPIAASPRAVANIWRWWRASHGVGAPPEARRRTARTSARRGALAAVSSATRVVRSSRSLASATCSTAN